MYFRKYISKSYSFAVVSKTRQNIATCQAEKLQEAELLCHSEQVTSQWLGCDSSANENGSGPRQARERRLNPQETRQNYSMAKDTLGQVPC